MRSCSRQRNRVTLRGRAGATLPRILAKRTASRWSGGATRGGDAPEGDQTGTRGGGKGVCRGRGEPISALC